MDSPADLKLARAAAESRLQTMLSLVPPAINENALNSFWAALNSAQQHLVDIDKRLSTWQSATVASSGVLQLVYLLLVTWQFALGL
jgi:hypothetical protein